MYANTYTHTQTQTHTHTRDPCHSHNVAAYVDTPRLVAVGRRMHEASNTSTPILGPHSPDGGRLGPAKAAYARRIRDQLCLTDFAEGVPCYELRSWEGDTITNPSPPGLVCMYVCTYVCM